LRGLDKETRGESREGKASKGELYSRLRRKRRTFFFKKKGKGQVRFLRRGTPAREGRLLSARGVKKPGIKFKKFQKPLAKTERLCQEGEKKKDGPAAGKEKS